MQRISRFLKFPRLALIAAALILGLFSATTPEATQPAKGSALTPSFSVVKINSRTGRLVFESPAGDATSPLLTPELRNSLDRSTEGLEITTGAGGGKMVNLRGRFRTLNVAQQTDSGLAVECVGTMGDTK